MHDIIKPECLDAYDVLDVAEDAASVAGAVDCGGDDDVVAVVVGLDGRNLRKIGSLVDGRTLEGLPQEGRVYPTRSIC